ncbi:MAG: TetR/AcrR family transcriptional regulator [Pseudomonadota bacterium]
MDSQPHYTPAFDRLPADKKERILGAAVSEFAAKGFSAANINTIALGAGISIGAMYKYFKRKDDLFLTVIDRAYGVLEQVLSDIAGDSGGFFDKIERMIRAAQDYSRRYPQLNQIYLDMTSEGLAHLSRQLSGKLESISAHLYQHLIAEAAADGHIAGDMDPAVAAFCLDNLILMLQFSYTSDYFMERMKVFIGEGALVDDERIAAGIMQFIRRALAPGDPVR